MAEFLPTESGLLRLPKLSRYTGASIPYMKKVNLSVLNFEALVTTTTGAEGSWRGIVSHIRHYSTWPIARKLFNNYFIFALYVFLTSFVQKSLNKIYCYLIIFSSIDYCSVWQAAHCCRYKKKYILVRRWLHSKHGSIYLKYGRKNDNYYVRRTYTRWLIAPPVKAKITSHFMNA